VDKDRRKFKRFDAYMSVKYKGPGHQTNEGVSLSKDLSREGIKVNSKAPLEKGATVDLEITIPDDPKPIQTSGKVMWSTPSGDQQGFDQGVRFITIDPVDKFRVLDFAYNHWLETKVNDFSDPEELSDNEYVVN
jgi:c-di-GMP-binding flagellar brake protein YcgR